LNLGKLEGIQRENFKLLSDRIEQKLQGLSLLFNDLPAGVEKAADTIYHQIVSGHLLDYAVSSPPRADIAAGVSEQDIRSVDINSIENEDSRTLGGEWLCKQMMDASGLPKHLMETIKDPHAVRLMMAEIIARMLHPSSELETSRWMGCESCLCELLGIAKAPSHKALYKAARLLYDNKAAIETFLYQQMEDKYSDTKQLRLFDLTNFYFEGRKEESAQAQFGRSKEKRSDAKLISLAMLTNGRGFVCKSKFYKGNISESSTLEEIINDLEASQASSLFSGKPVAVMDAGIATNGNLACLRKKGMDYICVSRSSLKEYEAVSQSPVIVMDNRKHPIEIQHVRSKDEADTDLYLYVKSGMKAIKERSMNKKLQGRFEMELQKIKDALYKKNGTKIKEKVDRRIGRLLEKYKSVGSRYGIELTINDENIVTEMVWVRNKEVKTEGVYFVRCSKQLLTEELIWNIYNTLRDIESTFRCLKTDLDIRPIYHQKDVCTEAHLYVGIVAYQLVHAIRQELKTKDIRHDWRHIRNIMSSQTIITTAMNLENKDRLMIRQPSRPNQHAAEIYNVLKFKQKPPHMKTKSVVPHSG
jgi:transposase